MATSQWKLTHTPGKVGDGYAFLLLDEKRLEIPPDDWTFYFMQMIEYGLANLPECVKHHNVITCTIGTPC